MDSQLFSSIQLIECPRDAMQGDPYSVELVYKWANEMIDGVIKVISLSDTISIASPEQIKEILEKLQPSDSATTIGLHLHASKNNWKEKVAAALHSGCRRFDGAINGIGGCPMAQEELVGNVDSVQLIEYIKDNGGLKKLNQMH